jgi:hypothetical protein
MTMPARLRAGNKLGVPEAVGGVEEGVGAVADGDELLVGVRPVGLDLDDGPAGLGEEPRDADHEELVEVGEEDARGNLTRSKRGTSCDAASARTRALNSSQESSRFRYCAGSFTSVRSWTDVEAGGGVMEGGGTSVRWMGSAMGGQCSVIGQKARRMGVISVLAGRTFNVLLSRGRRALGGRGARA